MKKTEKRFTRFAIAILATTLSTAVVTADPNTSFTVIAEEDDNGDPFGGALENQDYTPEPTKQNYDNYSIGTDTASPIVSFAPQEQEAAGQAEEAARAAEAEAARQAAEAEAARQAEIARQQEAARAAAAAEAARQAEAAARAAKAENNNSNAYAGDDLSWINNVVPRRLGETREEAKARHAAEVEAARQAEAAKQTQETKPSSATTQTPATGNGTSASTTGTSSSASNSGKEADKTSASTSEPTAAPKVTRQKAKPITDVEAYKNRNAVEIKKNQALFDASTKTVEDAYALSSPARKGISLDECDRYYSSSTVSTLSTKEAEDIEASVKEYLNAQRVEAGLSTLKRKDLGAAAWAEMMLETGLFVHANMRGSLGLPSDIVQGGENIIYIPGTSYTNVAEVSTRLWNDSEGHYYNRMYEDWTYYDCAVVRADNGKTYYLVERFGR